MPFKLSTFCRQLEGREQSRPFRWETMWVLCHLERRRSRSRKIFPAAPSIARRGPHEGRRAMLGATGGAAADWRATARAERSGGRPYDGRRVAARIGRALREAPLRRRRVLRVGRDAYIAPWIMHREGATAGRRGRRPLQAWTKRRRDLREGASPSPTASTGVHAYSVGQRAQNERRRVGSDPLIAP